MYHKPKEVQNSEKIYKYNFFLHCRFTKDLPDHLLFVSIGMAVTAIFGIVNVALAAAYVAQIMRKEKGFDFSQGVREDPPLTTMRIDSFN